jgi:hypothetical protein
MATGAILRCPGSHAIGGFRRTFGCKGRTPPGIGDDPAKLLSPLEAAVLG